MSIELKIMTRELCHELYKKWENDEAIYMDMKKYSPYTYNAMEVDKYFDTKQQSSRILFAIMLHDSPIGELHLKQIDYDKKICTMSIHMQNNKAKGHGYGTEAERLAIAYAFDVLNLNRIFADTVLKNTRSQHVLEKVGFKFMKEDGDFKYYCIER